MRGSLWKLCSCLVLSLPGVMSFAGTPYAWPPLPDKQTMETVLAVKSRSGLVVVDKSCTLTIKSYLASPQGVTRDEFVRLVVVNGDGVRSAAVALRDNADAKIESVAGRTVTPDGRVVPVDPGKDMQKVDISDIKQKKIVGSLATVHFPAPAIGAILDLHFVTFIEGPRIFQLEAVTYDETPQLHTSYTINIRGGISGYRWGVLLLSNHAVDKQLGPGPHDSILLTIGPIIPYHSEPLSPPPYLNEVTLLCYVNFASEIRDKDAGAYKMHEAVDPTGRITISEWPKAFQKFWRDELKEESRAAKVFMEWGGRAGHADLAAIAPPSLPLEERVQRLYDYVQQTIPYDPDAKDVSSLSFMMKHGQNAVWQGTLYLEYLLNRAHIPARHCVIANRYYLPFSPMIGNDSLYDLMDAVCVTLPNGQSIFLTPGVLPLPFGCLTIARQNSLALWLDSGKNLVAAPVGCNPPGVDRVCFQYDAKLTPSGTIEGEMTVERSGEPALDLRWWQLMREFRRTHPLKTDTTSPQERRNEFQKMMREACDVPGDRITTQNFVLAPLSKDPSDPVKIQCTFQGANMVQPLQQNSLVSVVPLLAGFVSPFPDRQRATPIWYETDGEIEMTGTLTLPPGSQVVDLPKPETVQGPNNTTIHFSVATSTKGGSPMLVTKVSFDQPPVMGWDLYRAWQDYQTALARLGNSRCVVRMPAATAGELQ